MEVKEYINSLPEGFLPFDTFLGVVSAQYETSKMPELALLKNKLLQYQNSFAQNKEEIYALKAEIQMNNITYIDIDEDSDDLQRELIEYIHENLQDIDKYLYLFVKLTSKNTDKKLLQGKIKIDYRLDLHGCKLEEAYSKLKNLFIAMNLRKTFI